MKCKMLIPLLCFMAMVTQLKAQDDKIEPISWEESPKWIALADSLNGEPEVVTKLHRYVEFMYSPDYNDRLVEYYTVHKKIRVNSDDAIEYNNKVYINTSSTLRIVDAKARVITPSNKIINFDTTNIKSSEGGDGKDAHSYFAIDGIEKGSDVEYTYTLLKMPSYEGVKYTYQSEYLLQDAMFLLAAPDNLVFSFKSYNGFPTVVLDSTREDKNVYRGGVDHIYKREEEDYAAYDRNLQTVVFKLRGNKGTGKYNLITFGEISQKLYTAMHSGIEKSDIKALDKMITTSGAKNGKTTDDKIRLLENYLKLNIQSITGVDTKPLKDILSDRYTSKFGMTYLFINSLEALGINYELVLTTDRTENFFDENFEHYQVLTNTMIYIPETKKYVVPDDFVYRYGIMPSDWAGQKGLFIKEVAIGEIKTGVGKVKEIKPLLAEETVDLMDITLTFEDISEPILFIKRKLTGYSSIYFQPIYSLIDEDKKKELDESMLKFSDSNGEVLEYTVKGVEQEDVGVNPLEYTGKLKSTTLVEKAGNKYLLKIGEAIGPQAEMYEDQERKLDIEHDHNMSYERIISFQIPDGYSISGFEGLSMNEVYPANNPIIGFVSEYKLEGDLITIKINEFYKEMFFDKSLIEDFRRVINAAANFNKVVLFLEKK